MGAEQLPNFLLKRAHLTPNRPALVFENKTYTFADLSERAHDIAGKLQADGVKKGAQVGVLLKNHPDTIFTLLALQLLGTQAVLLNGRLTAGEIAWQVNDAKIDYFVTEEHFHHIYVHIQRQFHLLQMRKKEDFQTMKWEEPTIVEEVILSDVCTMMYTSGTTGHPKGVLQTYGNHWWSAVGAALNMGLADDDSWLLAVPLFHISGYSILMRSLIYGMKIVMFETFKADEIIEAIDTEHVTIMSAVSTMLVRMLEELGDKQLPDHFRCLLLGGGPAAKTLLDQCSDRKIPVYQTYGMTETSSQIVTLSPEYALHKLGSAGKALFPSQVKIVDDDGKRVSSNEPGEIRVKGPNVTKGYFNRERETAESFSDGWLATGDIGYLDEDGFLYVLDRRKDLIISGGENIYPAEIEGVLSAHDVVTDAGVIGMKDEKWGEVPVAFVVLDREIKVDELTEFCMNQLAKYKIPTQFFFVEDIPRNASRKILRRKLREMLDERMKGG